MDEGAQVQARLARIEELRRGAAPRAELLEEVRTLLRDGQEWLRAEDDREGGADVTG